MTEQEKDLIIHMMKSIIRGRSDLTEDQKRQMEMRIDQARHEADVLTELCKTLGIPTPRL